MTRDDSRALPFAEVWLGASLAALVGIASTVELGAMPIPAAGVQLPGPILIQQATGPQSGAAQPGGPPAAGAGKPDSFSELHEALTAARQRLEEVSKAAAAVAATGQLHQELTALRQQNQQLRAELEAVRAERAELGTAKQTADAQTAELTKLRTEAEAQLSQLRDGLEQAEQEKARADADLARIQGELASAKEEAAAAGQERAQSGQQAAALKDERDDLRTRLADATARLGWSEAARTQLEREVAELRQAADTAAADARQSLIAVETRIKELNEALAAIAPAAAPVETDTRVRAASTPSAREQSDGEPRAAAAPAERVAAVTAPTRAPEPGNADGDLPPTETASATQPGEAEDAHLDQRGILGGRPAVFPLLADLPGDKRQHVQGLLAELHGKLDARGLMTTVPGELLFAVGSDEVQPSAYETLAKVAELIRLYDDRPVLISGHSDSDGNAADNQRLSERRAEVVKQIFVYNFGLAPDRLSTEGLGEARPVASNATLQGRRANRRVEVLILN
jgi:outer membrane protein OmpA-like peptidoglycan-associated protein